MAIDSAPAPAQPERRGGKVEWAEREGSGTRNGTRGREGEG